MIAIPTEEMKVREMRGREYKWKVIGMRGKGLEVEEDSTVVSRRKWRGEGKCLVCV